MTVRECDCVSLPWLLLFPPAVLRCVGVLYCPGKELRRGILQVVGVDYERGFNVEHVISGSTADLVGFMDSTGGRDMTPLSEGAAAARVPEVPEVVDTVSMCACQPRARPPAGVEKRLVYTTKN